MLAAGDMMRNSLPAPLSARVRTIFGENATGLGGLSRNSLPIVIRCAGSAIILRKTLREDYDQLC